MVNTWINDSSLINGLPDVGWASDSDIFYMDGVLYLISGDLDCVWEGYYWSGTCWIRYDNIIIGLADHGQYGRPTVFNMDNIWYLITGEGGYSADFWGYYWSETSWYTCPAIVNGLPALSWDSLPEVFYMDGLWYLIAGRESGAMRGWRWDGEMWENYPSIVGGLPSGIELNASVFCMNTIYYLILGMNTGAFLGYRWSGAIWEAYPAIISGLGDVGAFSTPTTFLSGITRYLISGKHSGLWSGFYCTEQEISDKTKYLHYPRWQPTRYGMRPFY